MTLSERHRDSPCPSARDAGSLRVGSPCQVTQQLVVDPGLSDSSGEGS